MQGFHPPMNEEDTAKSTFDHIERDAAQTAFPMADLFSGPCIPPSAFKNDSLEEKTSRSRSSYESSGAMVIPASNNPLSLALEHMESPQETQESALNSMLRSSSMSSYPNAHQQDIIHRAHYHHDMYSERYLSTSAPSSLNALNMSIKPSKAPSSAGPERPVLDLPQAFHYPAQYVQQQQHLQRQQFNAAMNRTLSSSSNPSPPLLSHSIPQHDRPFFKSHSREIGLSLTIPRFRPSIPLTSSPTTGLEMHHNFPSASPTVPTTPLACMKLEEQSPQQQQHMYSLLSPMSPMPSGAYSEPAYHPSSSWQKASGSSVGLSQHESYLMACSSQNSNHQDASCSNLSMALKKNASVHDHAAVMDPLSLPRQEPTPTLTPGPHAPRQDVSTGLFYPDNSHMLPAYHDGFPNYSSEALIDPRSSNNAPYMTYYPCRLSSLPSPSIIQSADREGDRIHSPLTPSGSHSFRFPIETSIDLDKQENDTSSPTSEHLISSPSTSLSTVAARYRCACGKLFQKLCGLKSHIKVHQSQGARLSVNDQGELEWLNEAGVPVIARAEEVTRNFICEVCNRSFLRKQDLRRHKSTHTSTVKKFRCDHCGTTFSRSDALYRHNKAQRCRTS